MVSIFSYSLLLQNRASLASNEVCRYLRAKSDATFGKERRDEWAGYWRRLVDSIDIVGCIFYLWTSLWSSSYILLDISIWLPLLNKDCQRGRQRSGLPSLLASLPMRQVKKCHLFWLEQQTWPQHLDHGSDDGECLPLLLVGDLSNPHLGAEKLLLPMQ